MCSRLAHTPAGALWFSRKSTRTDPKSALSAGFRRNMIANHGGYRATEPENSSRKLLAMFMNFCSTLAGTRILLPTTPSTEFQIGSTMSQEEETHLFKCA